MIRLISPIRRIFRRCAIPVWLSVALAHANSSAQARPMSILRQAHIDEHAGAMLPANLSFLDDCRHPVTLGDCIANKPAILILGYYACPDLCPTTLRHVTQGLNGVALRAGRDFNVMFVSIDARETPAEAATHKIDYVRAYKGGSRDADVAAGWHFLTGSQASIDRLKQVVGFTCTYDEAHERFSHAAGIIVVTPSGRLSHYFFGTDYSPRDLDAALRDAAAGKITHAGDDNQVFCFAYDPTQAKHGRIVWALIRGAGITWVGLLLGYITFQLIKDRRTAARPIVSTPGEEQYPWK